MTSVANGGRGRGAGAVFREAQRLFVGEGSGGVPLADPGEALELSAATTEPARIVSSVMLEGSTLRQHRIEGGAEPGFAAFLDGTQRSHVVHYARGIPLILGTVAAVVRVRANRRMLTWRRPIVETRLYAPKRCLSAELWERAERGPWEVIDTSEAHGGSASNGAVGAAPAEDAPAHPFELAQRAIHAVQEHRERLEERLAKSWCADEKEPLFIDGGISRSEIVARAHLAVGVIKSHRTLYVDGAALQAVLSLPQGVRSSVFRVTSRRRTPVASWYLRLRDCHGRDPMWGLVRVEAALPSAGDDIEELTTRADRISRWILAEAAPLALPDARWDKMVYGIRDCEEFLRALGP